MAEIVTVLIPSLVTWLGAALSEIEAGEDRVDVAETPEAAPAPISLPPQPEINAIKVAKEATVQMLVCFA